MTVDADDAEGLREAIARQEQLAHPVGAAWMASTSTAEA